VEVAGKYMKKKAKRVSRSIVVGHLEKISSSIFDKNRGLITEMIKGHYGVYALYRREKLYYVGLATDLRKRINQHLRDRHKAKWTHFSLYILRKTEHLREIEALLMRIADPTGNYRKGKLKRSKDLRPELRVRLAEDFKRNMDEILGITRGGVKKVKKKTGRRKGKELPLKDLLRNGQGIYANYKGKTYKAVVYSSGLIRFGGKKYSTPSGAGMAIINAGAVNGWNFWKYKDSSGNLVALKKLKKLKK